MKVKRGVDTFFYNEVIDKFAKKKRRTEFIYK